MTEIWTVFAIIGVVVVLFMWDRFPVVIVCLGCSLALWASGLLTINQALAGFGDPATLFVASLFVLSAGLEVTGVTAWAGQLLISSAGQSRVRLITFMMLLVGGLCALISVNGAVAALLPVVVVLAVRLGRSPSQLLMPLVFGAHCGSMLLLTGTPVNVLIAEALAGTGVDGFSYFEFGIVGIPLIAGGILIAVFFGERLLPTRDSANLPADLSQHAKTLVEGYRLSSDVYALRLRETSPLCGRARATLDLGDRGTIKLMGVRSEDGSASVRAALSAGDMIIVRGDAEAVGQLATELDLGLREETVPGDRVQSTLFNRDSGLAEVIIPPRSPLIGKRFFPGMVTESGDLIVLAIQRQGEDLAHGSVLSSGDTLLLQGTWDALDKRLNKAEVLVVDSPDLVRRQAVPMGNGAKTMLGIMGAMVVLLATGIVPAAVAGLGAACAVVLLGILTVEQMYRAINWTTVILVGALLPLSVAIEQSGAAALLANGLVDLVGDAGPRALLAGLFILTAIMGQIISNTATAVILIPIAVVAANQMGVSPAPVLMAVGVAAAAAFLTPVATPTNLMVMEPGNYRFGDYWKLGLPMMIWFFIVAVFFVPLVWSF